MKVVTWNMNHCMRRPELRRRAWEYLQDELAADVALLQEAAPPVSSSFARVFRPISEKKPRLAWGSAVVSFRENITLVPRPRVPLVETFEKSVTGAELPDSHPGACAVADVHVDGKFKFTAVSLYGQWEAISDGRIYSCARLHRMISDLTGVFATSRKKPVLVAGDFNVTTQVAYLGQTQADTDGAAAVFARLRAWGLRDCMAQAVPRLENCSCPDKGSCCHVQTFRLKNRPDSRPTQLDYVFASSALASNARCEVVQTSDAWAVSDHCPVAVRLDL